MYKRVKLDIGDTFGSWIVIGKALFRSGKKYIRTPYECRCECGTIKVLDARRLINGKTTCCWDCGRKKVNDQRRKLEQQKQIGRKYGRWTVVSFVGYMQLRTCIRPLYKCRCDCGFEIMPKSFNKFIKGTTRCFHCDKNDPFSYRFIKKMPYYTLVGEIKDDYFLNCWKK